MRGGQLVPYGRKKHTKVLITNLEIANGSPEGHQALAYLMHRGLLKSVLGVSIKSVTITNLDSLFELLKKDQSEIAVIMTSWREDQAEIARVLKESKRAMPARKLVFLDYYAPTASPRWGLLPLVDIYAKRQLLKDKDKYQNRFEGGTIFTDFLVKQRGYSLDGWYFGSTPDAQAMHKVVLSWNLGVTPRYRFLLALSRIDPRNWSQRRLDVNSRISIIDKDKKKEWYETYRHESYLLLEPLGKCFKLTPNGRIGFSSYLSELFQSKIVFSPFGWGELCFRDFEAVCCGCLLIKPSMDHLETSPNIFVDGVTYVAVRWDLSDLVEKVTYYLSNPSEATKIVRAAQKVLSEYYSKGLFAVDFARTIGLEMRSQTR